jgi:hypothetical protein
VAIIPSVFSKMLKEGGFQARAFKSWAKDNNLLVCDKDRLDKTFRKGGTTQKYTVLKIGYDTDSEFESTDLEELPFT